jgi:hypothetical protein
MGRWSVGGPGGTLQPPLRPALPAVPRTGTRIRMVRVRVPGALVRVLCNYGKFPPPAPDRGVNNLDALVAKCRS